MESLRRLQSGVSGDDSRGRLDQPGEAPANEARVQAWQALGLARGCLRVLPTWWLASSSVSNPREQSRSRSTLCDLALEVTYCHIGSAPFCFIGHETKAGIPRGAILEAGCHALKLLESSPALFTLGVPRALGAGGGGAAVGGGVQAQQECAGRINE